jgi:hypothetical protein
MKSGGIDPRVLNVGFGRRCMASFTLRPLFHWGNNLGTSLVGVWVGATVGLDVLAMSRPSESVLHSWCVSTGCQVCHEVARLHVIAGNCDKFRNLNSYRIHTDSSSVVLSSVFWVLLSRACSVVGQVFMCRYMFMAMYSFASSFREAKFCGVPSYVFDRSGCTTVKKFSENWYKEYLQIVYCWLFQWMVTAMLGEVLTGYTASAIQKFRVNKKIF